VIGDILQPTHLIFILVVALLVLGPKRLPEVGKSLGRGIRDFRGALSGMDEDHAPVPTPVAPVTPATTTTSMAASHVEDAAHGYVPVAEATAATPTPVAGTETLALDESAVASAPQQDAGQHAQVASADRPPQEAPAAAVHPD
jgi:sec-independent protein translocase protein TatA